jgi:AcrR family transcriptional regulator
MHEAVGQEPRWRRMPEERPRQILDAALEVFGERGLAGARLDDIAKRAGIAKGTIYLYFPSKEELFVEMIRQTMVALIEEGERGLEGTTPSEQLASYVRSHWDFVRTPAFETIYRLVIGELHNFPDLARFYSEEVVARAVRLLGGMLERGVASGEFRPIDPWVASRMLMSLLATHALWCRRQPFFSHMAGTTDEQVLAQILDFYFRAISPVAGDPVGGRVAGGTH